MSGFGVLLVCFLKLWIRSQNKKNKFHLYVIERMHNAQVSINFKGTK